MKYNWVCVIKHVTSVTLLDVYVEYHSTFMLLCLFKRGRLIVRPSEQI